MKMVGEKMDKPSTEQEETILNGINALLKSNQKMLRIKKVLTIVNIFLVLILVTSAYILYEKPKEPEEGEETHYHSNYYYDRFTEYGDSGGIKLHHAEGWVNNNSDVTLLHLYVSLYSLTDAVDVEQELILHLEWLDGPLFEGPKAVANLMHVNSTSRLKNGLEMFTHNTTLDPHGSMEHSGVLDRDSLIMIEIDFNEFGNSTNPANNRLRAYSSVVIDFIFNTNENSIESRLRVPYNLSDNTGWIELY